MAHAQKKRSRTHRLLVDIAIELIGLVLLGVFLYNNQMQFAVQKQKSNSQTKLFIAGQRLDQYKSEADEALESHDAFNQAKADTAAFFFQRNPDFDGDIPGLARDCGMSLLLQINSAGAITRQSASLIYDVPLERILSGMDPVSVGSMRYYSASTSDGGRVVVGMPDRASSEVQKELRSLSYALSGIRVGTTGYIIAVNPTDQTISYHPDAEFIGRRITSYGVPGEALADGFCGWIRLDGVKYYTCTSHDDSGDILLAAAPESEFIASVTKMVAASLTVFFIVVTLLILYATFIRQEQEENQSYQYVKLNRYLYYNRAIGTRIRHMTWIGLLLIFLMAFYAQSLLALSRQNLLSDTKLDAVSATLENNDVRMESLLEDYNEEYAQRAKTIATFLSLDTGMLDNAVLGKLADRIQVQAIYVFDDTGSVVATNTVYQDFQLSRSQEDQSYPFWDVVHGYSDLLVQEAMADDSAEHRYTQYVGVKRLDAPGMVQIGVSPKRLAGRLASTALTYVLNNIAVEDGGFLFAVDLAHNTILAYPNEKYIGRLCTDYGLTETALKDAYSGYQTIENMQYFVSCNEVNGNAILCAVPTSRIFDTRTSVALTVTLASFIVILCIVCRLVFTTQPEDPVPVEAGTSTSTAPEKINFFRIMPGGEQKQIQSASHRWHTGSVPWKQKTPEQKLLHIIGIVFGVVAAVLAIFLLTRHGGYDRTSILSYIINRKWERSVNMFALTYIALSVLEIMVVSTIVRKVIVVITQTFGARTETVGRLVDSFIKYVAIIASIFYGLSCIGVETSTIITSASILTIVVGLGAQSLISDILAGIFIVFEGEFRVGDIVTIGDWRGTVLEIGIRTTKIEDAMNNIKIFSNSAITGVVNMTRQYSVACCDVGIEYGESLERVESILKKELPHMKEKLPIISAGPFYKGVVSLGDSSVVIRIVAQCAETDRVQLNRDLNREIKLIFDRYNVGIPFPQIVVNQPTNFEKASRADKKNAEAFIREQEEISHHLHVEEEED